MFYYLSIDCLFFVIIKGLDQWKNVHNSFFPIHIYAIILALIATALDSA